MANHDFNRPCDCRECRTISFVVACPHCAFENLVLVVQESHWETDRKGIGYYSFTLPNKIGKDFDCFKCGSLVQNTRYFDEIDTELCKTKLERQDAIERREVCTRCGAVKGYDYSKGIIEKVDQLYTIDNENLCKSCYGDYLAETSPDPSDADNRYTFNRRTFKWELARVRRACSVCGKIRWLNVKNAWKAKCSKCYQHP